MLDFFRESHDRFTISASPAAVCVRFFVDADRCMNAGMSRQHSLARCPPEPLQYREFAAHDVGVTVSQEPDAPSPAFRACMYTVLWQPARGPFCQHAASAAAMSIKYSFFRPVTTV